MKAGSSSSFHRTKLGWECSACCRSLAASSLVDILENNKTYLNQNPKGEPQLGKRGLYGSIGGQTDGRVNELAMLWS